MDELERCAGTQFDPELVEAFAGGLGRSELDALVWQQAASKLTGRFGSCESGEHRSCPVGRRGCSGGERRGSAPGTFGIFEVRIDGTERTALLRKHGCKAWRRCLRIEGGSCSSSVRLLGAGVASLQAAVDGRGVRLLATGSFIGAPAWSPDGQQIAFEAEDPARCIRPLARCAREIACQSERHRLTMWVPRGIAPSWSPDSQRIAFAGHYNPYFRRGVVSAPASATRAGFASSARWSTSPGRTGSRVVAAREPRHVCADKGRPLVRVPG